MKLRLSGIVCACSLVLPAVVNAALFDFQDWINTNGEQGFNNAAPFSLTDSGLTLTATAFDQPGMVVSHVYMDGLFNGIIGGMGVCTTLDGSKQCVPSSDDNVSIDGTSQEILSWDFSANINGITLEMGNSQHPAFASSNFEYRINGGGWLTGTTNATGFVSLDFGVSANNIDFRTAGANITDQFYIRNAAIVPVPAAVWLFSSGLLGLAGMVTRRKKRLVG